jgi:hypothetical protein
MQLQGRTPTDHTQQDHHNGDDQQDVNEATQRVRGDKAKQPENQKNDGDGVEHGGVLSKLVSLQADEAQASRIQRTPSVRQFTRGHEKSLRWRGTGKGF